MSLKDDHEMGRALAPVLERLAVLEERVSAIVVASGNGVLADRDEERVKQLQNRLRNEAHRLNARYPVQTEPLKRQSRKSLRIALVKRLDEMCRDARDLLGSIPDDTTAFHQRFKETRDVLRRLVMSSSDAALEEYAAGSGLAIESSFSSEDLVGALRRLELQAKQDRDHEMVHSQADELLLEFIGDPEVTALHKKLARYCA